MPLFIREVWYGQRSLAETWWFWNVLIVNILLGEVVALITILSAILSGSYFPFLLSKVLTIPCAIWIIVGIWRSASNTGSFWADVAKFLLIIQSPLVIYRVYTIFSSTNLTNGPLERAINLAHHVLKAIIFDSLGLPLVPE